MDIVYDRTLLSTRSAGSVWKLPCVFFVTVQAQQIHELAVQIGEKVAKAESLGKLHVGYIVVRGSPGKKLQGFSLPPPPEPLLLVFRRLK